jgi:hypothetical protein
MSSRLSKRLLARAIPLEKLAARRAAPVQKGPHWGALQNARTAESRLACETDALQPPRKSRAGPSSRKPPDGSLSAAARAQRTRVSLRVGDERQPQPIMHIGPPARLVFGADGPMAQQAANLGAWIAAGAGTAPPWVRSGAAQSYRLGSLRDAGPLEEPSTPPESAGPTT